MSGYLVRVAGTNEIVGFYVARDLVDLFWLIDEVMNPRECEYTAIESGGIYWDEVGSPKVEQLQGYTGDICDFPEINLDGAVASEELSSAMQCQVERKWKSGEQLYKKMSGGGK